MDSKLQRQVDEIARQAGMTPPVDRERKTLTDGSPVTDDHRELRPDGQQKGYVVLSDEERARGFVRPVRRSYVHVGKAVPRYALRDLTADENGRLNEPDDAERYVKFEEYPAGSRSRGRYWAQADLDKIGKGCGAETRMGVAIAETYARDPNFYSGTFCVGCGQHFPVGANGEFVWSGTDERVGT